MADQSSAADEYAILQEITAPLTMLPDDPVAIVVDVDFPVVMRGYDRVAVDAYVKRMSQLVAELDAGRSPEAAIRRAIERVGEQISGILQRAHDSAGQMIARSRVEAEDRLEVSCQEAALMAAAGEQRRRDLDADTDRIWAERLRIVEDARGLADQLIALAESATERFPAAGPGVTAEPEVGAEPRAVAELWAAAAGRAADHDVTAVLPPVGPARDAPPPKDE
jgi:cell division septum initiation protein DivIVA